jgi:hypothetical protein
MYIPWYKGGASGLLEIYFWLYISPYEILVRPYNRGGWAWNNWVTNYVVPFRNYSGPLQYIPVSELQTYTSEAKQSIYDYTSGSLEFSIDQYPGEWRKSYSLPPIESTTPLKVSVRNNKVVNGVRYLPLDTIRLSGVEYNL